MASSNVERWSVHLRDLHARIAHRFRRPEVRERVWRRLVGPLGRVERKNGFYEKAEFFNADVAAVTVLKNCSD